MGKGSNDTTKMNEQPPYRTTSTGFISESGDGKTGPGGVTTAESAATETYRREVEDQSPEDIRRDIERTRADMDETVEAIRYRLSPRQIADQSIDTMRSLARSAGPRITNTVRNHPIPSALIALGVGMMAMGGTRRGREIGYDIGSRARERTRGAREAIRERASSAGHRAGEMGHGTRERLAEMGHTVKEKVAGALHRRERGDEDYETSYMAGEYSEMEDESREGLISRARQRSSDMAHGMAERTTGLASSAKEGVGYVAHRAGAVAKTGARRAKEGFDHAFYENPIGAGAVAVALGAAIGLMLPHTRREDEWMGERRDRIMERARDKGREVAGVVREHARDAARDVKEDLRSHLQEARQNVKEDVQGHMREVRRDLKADGEEFRSELDKETKL